MGHVGISKLIYLATSGERFLEDDWERNYWKLSLKWELESQGSSRENLFLFKDLKGDLQSPYVTEDLVLVSEPTRCFHFSFLWGKSRGFKAVLVCLFMWKLRANIQHYIHLAKDQYVVRPAGFVSVCQSRTWPVTLQQHANQSIDPSVFFRQPEVSTLTSVTVKYSSPWLSVKRTLSLAAVCLTKRDEQGKRKRRREGVKIANGRHQGHYSNSEV